MAEDANAAQTVQVARDYYNSEDADNFYHLIWGGEDIHVGLYSSPDEEIAVASRRTVETMAAKSDKLTASARILDIGSGYGGALRYLVKRFGCQGIGLNLSEVENERHREKNVQVGLGDKIEVVEGSFESIPFEDHTFDLVWSQDAILHSGDRAEVFAEVERVLKPGGEFLFTDPMQSDDCPPGVLRPILDRIHLESLGSPRTYEMLAKQVGLEKVEFDDRTQQLVNHYSAVLRETQRQQSVLREHVSQGYIDRMKKGLEHWIDGGKRGYLAWGMLRFRKS